MDIIKKYFKFKINDNKKYNITSIHCHCNILRRNTRCYNCSQLIEHRMRARYMLYLYLEYNNELPTILSCDVIIYHMKMMYDMSIEKNGKIDEELYVSQINTFEIITKIVSNITTPQEITESVNLHFCSYNFSG